MAHDYSYNKETIQDSWCYMEVKYKDIEEVSKKNKLDFYLQKYFDKVAWLCMKKRIK